MADPRPHYNPTEVDALHRKAIVLGTQRLLDRLRAQHPRIVAHLTRKQDQVQEQEQAQ